MNYGAGDSGPRSNCADDRCRRSFRAMTREGPAGSPCRATSLLIEQTRETVKGWIIMRIRWQQWVPLAGILVALLVAPATASAHGLHGCPPPHHHWWWW